METTPTPTREEILANALAAREREVMHYQINIDNYTMALQEIEALPESERLEHSEFAGQLQALLVTEKREQRKAKILMEVLRKQVAA